MPESAAQGLPALLPTLCKDEAFAVKSGAIVTSPASPERRSAGPALLGSVDVDALRRAKLERKSVGGADRLFVPAQALMPKALDLHRPEGAAHIQRSFTPGELKAHARHNEAVLEVLLKGVRERPSSTQGSFYGPLLMLKARHTIALPPPEFSALLEKRTDVGLERFVLADDRRQFDGVRARLQPFMRVMNPDAAEADKACDALVESMRNLQRDNIESAIKAVVQMEDQLLSTAALAARGDIDPKLKESAETHVKARRESILAGTSMARTWQGLPKLMATKPLEVAWADWEQSVQKLSKFRNPDRLNEVLAVRAALFQEKHAPSADVAVIKEALRASLAASASAPMK